ncbi:hypothetical protein EDF24_0587 [Curtobacterium sp. PhB130]|uniref:hypothetical protein n=1 Tax=unclassified Curtobacterium TaxID=257496 RepID=UPI000F4C4C3E|nr:MULTISPECIES: hypothetical protein [unclassified Curtobacterium]ROS77825.1 hypothetical protein EDF24_0587 [Curtobacterium sp. PhB130]TCK65960.1 hypothetical protein EDF27_0709 [Curtobacterium sp. PhB136]
MTDVLGLAAILPASAGACCTVGAWRPGRAVDVVAALVMVAAMVDGVFGPRVLPGVVWFLVLALLAVALAATSRFQRVGPGALVAAGAAGGAGGAGAAGAAGAAAGRPGSGPAGRPTGAHGRLHGALGLLVMGALGIGMTHGSGASDTAGMAGMHHTGTVDVVWQLVVGGLTLGYLLLTAHLVRDGLRRRTRVLPVLEALTMGIAVAVMAAAMV